VAEVPVVEGESDEPRARQSLRVVADHLVFHARERPGQRQGGQRAARGLRAVVGDPEIPDQPQALAEEVDPLCGQTQPPTPSCCISPAMSLSNQVARIFPSPMRRIAISVHFTSLPVGGMPKNSPLWVPPCVIRAPTRSASAAIRSMLTQ